MVTKKLSLTLLILFLAMFPLITAEVMSVECARDDDCGNGEVCEKIGSPEDWYCTQGQGDPALQDIQRTEQYTNESNSILLPSIIIGSCILIGFIILAIILSRKKN